VSGVVPAAPAAPELIVATTSRYRLALLDRLGLRYRGVAHRVDERAAEPEGSPEHVATTLARAKAESLAEAFPDALLLGSDQVVALGDELLHKPGDAANAVAQLARLAGRTHRIITAVALRHPDGSVDTHLDVHTMRMRALPEAALRAYVAADEPYDCAGSYKIEGLGIALFEAAAGEDYTGIIGLPLTAVVRLLARAGVHVFPQS
jgi:septum formation protein